MKTDVQPGRRRHRILIFLQRGPADIEEIRAAIAKPGETRRSTRSLVHIALEALKAEGRIRIAQGQHSLTEAGEQLLAHLAAAKPTPAKEPT